MVSRAKLTSNQTAPPLYKEASPVTRKLDALFLFLLTFTVTLYFLNWLIIKVGLIGRSRVFTHIVSFCTFNARWLKPSGYF